MKSIKKWRYYCDHCKKSGGSKYHMVNHESSCVKNPERYCGFCEVSKGSYDNSYLGKMVKLIKGHIVSKEDILCDSVYYVLTCDEKIIISGLKEMSGDCPACILAAIAQSGHAYLFSFNFKDEKEIFWSENKIEPPDYYGY